ncbi:hypothetical protein PG993_014848 [Apiospora rasikravindrae]|uniref:AAA+ ATPase domain-containing protein n=1 Tax=Apiospora rasikravindrae TaxID=990691 RepID=A0ABR1RNX6_9PEZI
MSVTVAATPSGGQETPEVSNQTPKPAAPQANQKARIGYRTEYRHKVTDELIKDEASDVASTDSAAAYTLGLIFEVVKTYRYTPRTDNKDNNWAIHSVASPTYSIRLYSPAIINALRTIVKYYPDQDLDGEITINAPYCILVHHYDELQKYARERQDKPPETLCVRDRDVAEHMRALIHFLDETVMEGVRAEMERNARGYYTFSHAWVAHKPGRTIICQYRSQNRWKPGIIKSVEGGTFTSPPTKWTIIYWKLKFDGRYLSRVWSLSTISPSDGEISFERVDRKVFDTSELEASEDHVVQELKEWGQFSAAIPTGRFSAAPELSTKTKRTQIDGLVMADAHLAVSSNPPSRLMDGSDLRKGGFHCPCAVCQATRAGGGESDFEAIFERYDAIGAEKWEEHQLTSHQYLLCPYVVRVFVFRTRSWEKVHVKNLSEPDFDESMVNNLIIDEKKKRTLTSLAKSFARRNQTEEKMPKPMWSADFVVGKGAGLTFLLHGRPGVGKTLTAECIAAFTKRPLMILTSSDIGTNPKVVEENLTKHFRNAKSWGAILLIDEADVFMERRSTADLTRNSLVAGFLRALEYYEGILFLTTNRVGSFDDAFISRVHVQLYYPEFTDDQRQKVWQTFIDKLQRDRKGYMRLNMDAKEYIAQINKSDLKWNGREIRNAFQTAVSLAEYDAEKDAEGTILVTDQHLRAVVELSKDFKDYLQELHMADEDKRAQGRAERLDSFKGEKN